MSHGTVFEPERNSRRWRMGISVDFLEALSFLTVSVGISVVFIRLIRLGGYFGE